MLKQKFFLNFISKILTRVLQFVASILVARLAGPGILGTLAFANSYVNAFGIIASLGTGGAHTKIVSEGTELGRANTTFGVIKSVLALLFALVVLSVFLVQKYYLGHTFESQVHEHVILIILVYQVLQKIILIPNATFIARTEIVRSSILGIANKVLLHLARIVIVLLGYGALTLAFGYLLSALLVFPVAWFLFKGYPFGKFDKKLAKRYLMISFPIILINFSESLMVSLDKVFLQFFLGSEQVGYYTAAMSIGGILSILTLGVSIFFPVFSAAFAKGQYQYIIDKIETFERFLFVFIMPFIIMLVIYSDTIIQVVLGDKYHESIPVVAMVTVAFFFRLLIRPYGNILTGKGKFKLAAIINAVNIVSFVFALYVFISPDIFNMGIQGAALSLILANLILGFLYIFYSKSILPNLKVWKNKGYLLLGFVFYFLLSYIYKIQPIISNEIIFKIVFLIVSFISMYMIYYFMGMIKYADVQLVKSIINIKSMRNYISSEMKDNKQKNDKK